MNTDWGDTNCRNFHELGKVDMEVFNLIRETPVYLHHTVSTGIEHQASTRAPVTASAAEALGA